MTHTFKKIQNEIKLATNGVFIRPEIFEKYYLSLLRHYINDRKIKRLDTYIVGLQGPQGIGKTVLATAFEIFLKSLGYEVKAFSIDDFYKSSGERLKMARTHSGNPFYQIARGMPGTHRYDHLFGVLKKIKSGSYCEIPKFDKSLCSGRGDITKHVTLITKQLQFVILEGWCVNMPHVENNRFLSLMNQDNYVKKTFNEIDPEHKHFKTVNKFVGRYKKIWDLIDNNTFIFGENIRWVEKWRAEQEERLLCSSGSGMKKEEIHNFVKPFIPFSYLFYEEIYKTPNKQNYCFLKVKRNHLPQEADIPNQ